jgi:hypothetical protein
MFLRDKGRGLPVHKFPELTSVTAASHMIPLPDQAVAPASPPSPTLSTAEIGELYKEKIERIKKMHEEEVKSVGEKK